MLFPFLYANTIVLSIFSASIVTTFGLCSYYNAPFYNPEDLGNNLNHIKQNLLPTYAGTVLIVLDATLTQNNLHQKIAQFVDKMMQEN
jgi:hypothetical protein